MSYVLSIGFWAVIFLGVFAAEMSHRIYTGAISIKLGLSIVGVYAAWRLDQLGITDFVAGLFGLST